MNTLFAIGLVTNNTTSTHLVWLNIAQIWVVKNILDWQTFNQIFNHKCDWTWSQQSNLSTNHTSLWWYTIKVWLQKIYSLWGYSRNGHILIMWTFTVPWHWRLKNNLRNGHILIMWTFTVPWHWRLKNNLLHDTGSWWCIIIPSLVTKG